MSQFDQIKLSDAGPPLGAKAPAGLESAAPSLPVQGWTDDRGEASREPRPARPRDDTSVRERGGMVHSLK